jgi:hypothetical protein
MIGAWEDGRFIGVVLFGRGANNSIGKEYGLDMTTCCELVRIAMRDHVAPVSKIVSIAIRFLKKSNPGLRMIVSYADPAQGHHGGIYQANGWTYTGKSQGSIEWLHNGRWKHNREVTAGAFGGSAAIDRSTLPKRKTEGKHKYLMPLDEEMKANIQHLSKPYPKRHAPEASSDAPTQPGRRGRGSTDPGAPMSNPNCDGAPE